MRVPPKPELLRNDQDWLVAFYREQFFVIFADVDKKAIIQLGKRVERAFSDAVDALAEKVRGSEPELIENLGIQYLYYDPFWIQREAIATGWYFRAIELDRPEVESLSEAIESWTDEHNLHALWVVDCIIRTLMIWQSLHGEPMERVWYPLRQKWYGALFEDELRTTIELEWEPSVESRSQARNRLIAQAEKAIDVLLAEKTGVARSRSFKPPVNPPNRAAEDLRYLVRYQVIRENFTQIATRDRRAKPAKSGRRTVEYAVKRAAKLVGLELRERDCGAAAPKG